MRPGTNSVGIKGEHEAYVCPLTSVYAIFFQAGSSPSLGEHSGPNSKMDRNLNSSNASLSGSSSIHKHSFSSSSSPAKCSASTPVVDNGIRSHPMHRHLLPESPGRATPPTPHQVCKGGGAAGIPPCHPNGPHAYELYDHFFKYPPFQLQKAPQGGWAPNAIEQVGNLQKLLHQIIDTVANITDNNNSDIF